MCDDDGTERCPSSSAIEADLVSRLNACEKDLFRLLNQRPRLRFWRGPSPEALRMWGLIKDDVSLIKRLLARGSPVLASRKAILRDLLKLWPASEEQWTLEFGREFGFS